MYIKSVIYPRDYNQSLTFRIDPMSSHRFKSLNRYLSVMLLHVVKRMRDCIEQYEMCLGQFHLCIMHMTVPAQLVSWKTKVQK